MKKEVMDELIADTTLEDVGESCRPLVELIGLENVLKLSTYSMGGVCARMYWNSSP